MTGLHIYIGEQPLLASDPRISQMLALQQQILASLKASSESIMATVADVAAKVAQETSIEASVLVLVQELSSMVKAAGTDPVALQAVVDQLDANINNLQAAVTANTPAA